MKYFLLALILSLLFPLKSFASSYVLPYPSEMPGSKLYPVMRILESVERYWYFGEFGSIMYTRKYADRYLIEAKTLFEYKQYALGYNALLRSNEYFKTEQVLLKKAKNKTGIDLKEALYKEQVLAHQGVLASLLLTTPKEVQWQEENKPGVTLYPHSLIDESSRMRRDRF